MKNTLLVGTKSAQRKKLLTDARIPFQIVQQDADEAVSDWHMPLAQLLPAIARQKMNHVSMPVSAEGTIAFVLTADTMGQDAQGIIHGKPTSRDDAIAKIRDLRLGGVVGTAFCLERKVYTHGLWRPQMVLEEYVEASYVFDMPDAWIQNYLQVFPDYMHVSGALSVEEYGAQFLKTINGSYTTILGLPMFELREALEKSGFFND